MTEQELAEKFEMWYRSAYNAFWQAGGNPDYILENMPSHVVSTLARNNIRFTYVKPENKE